MASDILALEGGGSNGDYGYNGAMVPIQEEGVSHIICILVYIIQVSHIIQEEEVSLITSTLCVYIIYVCVMYVCMFLKKTAYMVMVICFKLQLSLSSTGEGRVLECRQRADRYSYTYNCMCM
jgi:hypothetical protein